MNDLSLRKTYKYKLKPTPAQERELDESCGMPQALQHRAGAAHHRLRQRGVSLSRYEQEAELKDMRAEMPEYAAIHSHVLQDVLARLDRTYQAFFRRLREGQTRAGLPALSGAQSVQHFHLQGVRQRRDDSRGLTITASWSCPRLGALPCVGPAH